ncbi:MAG: dCTP deaminase [Acidobacteria bacterium]|nr:MAG: dCTP deaminase [Acidobacteriota bacterium]
MPQAVEGGSMSVLTRAAIRDRIFKTKDLKIKPLLDPESQIEYGAVNLTLGTQFILAKKSEYPLIDPRLLDTNEILKFQEKFTLAFGQAVALHPHQFALGATFEFLKLPPNLCAFVLTRSSFGRAGLQIATATYVHPSWRGCLTLELQNLGEVPIKLYCGSPICQLVLVEAQPALEEKPVKSIPVGPVFTDLRNQSYWEQYLDKFTCPGPPEA